MRKRKGKKVKQFFSSENEKEPRMRGKEEDREKKRPKETTT
jgi:hypothetical protein